MTATAPAQSKITYTSADVDWELFHRQFDDALAHVRSQLGRDYPLYIGGAAVTSSAKPIVDTSPIDTSDALVPVGVRPCRLCRPWRHDGLVDMRRSCRREVAEYDAG